MPEPKTAREPGPKPTFQVVEENLHYQTKAGKELVLNIDIPFGILLDATESADNEQQQFVKVLEAMGDTRTLTEIRQLGSVEAMKLITRFFEEFERLLGASVGEAQRSSDS